MSKANYIVGVQYTRHGGTYSAMLVSDQGDLYQQYTSYDASTKTATGVAPSFEGSNNHPVLQLAIFNSKSTGEVYPEEVTWTVGNTKIEFGSDGISTTVLNGETGHFKRVDANIKNKTRAGLMFMKNMVVASQATPFSISAVGVVRNGLSSVSVSAATNFGIKQATTAASVVNISVTNGGLVSANNNGYPSSVILTANVSATDGVTVSSNLKHQWYATDDTTGLFVELTGETSNTLTVTADDVNQSRLYKVVVSDAEGNSIGQDTQVVTDVSDPLRIEPNASPKDEQIIEGDSEHASVSWNPKLFRGEDEVTNGVSWSMTVYDSSGTPVFDKPITNKELFEVTEEMLINNGNVQVVIAASVG